jgi:hypothetical protein
MTVIAMTVMFAPVMNAALGQFIDVGILPT